MKALGVLHPDHLHDRARRGALSPEEWRRFGAHLASCPSCAWERALTDDFAREHHASEQRDVDGDLDRLVDVALLTTLTTGGDPPCPPPRGREASEVGLKPAAAPSAGRSLAVARWTTALMVAAAVAALALPLLKNGLEAPRDGGAASDLALSDASLDAGALGAPSGGS